MKRALTRAAIALLALVALLAAVILVRAATFTSVQRAVPPSTLAVDPEAVAARLGEAIRFPTVSGAAGEGEAPFVAMQGWLQASYPRFHEVATREAIAGHNLLYTWPGADPSRPPVLLMAHQDVVPVEPGTAADWTHPAFSGAIAPCGDAPGDCVWGRGAIDMKAALVGLFEACERLAAAGYRPQRTLMFAYGTDEEVGGFGNKAVADELRRRGVRFEWVLDEGLLVTDGVIPGAPAPVALIGLAEKGSLSLELIARSEGGHSSMPPRSTAAGRVARAVARLEADPFPAAIDGAVAVMFDRIGPEMPFGQRIALANRWLFDPLLVARLGASPTTDATLRTTQAATILEAGVQDNVLPQHARAVVNFRVHPRDSLDGVTERVRAVIDDPAIELRRLEGTDHRGPSPLARADAPGFALIEAAVRASWPEAIVGSGLFIAITDSRHYVTLADDVYRFHPIRYTLADRARVHGTDERLRVADLAALVRFYHHLLEAAGR